MRVLIGVTGSVAAAAMPLFCVYIRQRSVEIGGVLITRAGSRFVTPYALGLHAGSLVMSEASDAATLASVAHIELTRQADVLLIMPATANILAKAAHGICDDLVSTAIVAAPCPIVFVPSMNEIMWRNPIVQSNVRTLRAHGHDVLEPRDGLEVADLRPTSGCVASFDTVLHAITKPRPSRAGEQQGLNLDA